MTDPDLLRQVTEALWRGRSQQQIARALGVSDRTLRRWLIGSAPIPEGVWHELTLLTFQNRMTAIHANDAAAARFKITRQSEQICPSCNRSFKDGDTCDRGGCPMGGDF
jgi:transposase-like protein